MLKSLNSSLGLMVEDVANLKKDHGPRLSTMERNSLLLCKNLNMVINLSKEKLESSVEGLVFLNEKDREWIGRSLFSELVNQDEGEDAEKSLQVADLGRGPSVCTQSKTKKSKMVLRQDVDEIMEMHDKVISKDLEVARMLKEFL